MTIDHDEQVRLGIEIGLTELASYEGVQANCMFQLALIVARIAVEPCPEEYKDEAAQALIGLIRAKPKSNIVRLFGDKPTIKMSGQGRVPPAEIIGLTRRTEDSHKKLMSSTPSDCGSVVPRPLDGDLEDVGQLLQLALREGLPA